MTQSYMASMLRKAQIANAKSQVSLMTTVRYMVCRIYE